MLHKITFRTLLLFSISLVVVSGCVTPLPPAFNMPDRGSELPGSVSAIVLGNGQVAVANTDGVFVREDGGIW